MSTTDTVPQSLDWGDVVYAYGHLFAGEARVLGLEAPLHEGKLNREQLAQMVLVADFVGLERAGAVELSLSTGKLLFISTESVLARKLKDVPSGPVARAIQAQITGDLKKDGVKNIVYRLLGRDSVDPYGEVVGWAQQSLLKNGYYHEEERGRIAQMVAGSKKVPKREQLASLEPAARTVESALKAEETRQPAVYKRLKQDVLDALRSRVEQDRSDD
jgi:hypothetical protein